VSGGRRFPFTAVVGQDTARLALILAAVDPAIGGVLLRGDKGSGKSTLARGLAGVLPGDAPFVELPVGATEDRVVGGLDLGEAFAGAARLRPGLLASAHGGVLYVDEVNLLPDHLVDVLLDAASSGVQRVERDGLAAEMPARFVLVGSMNPEEGELRPQLLDRFGLAVEVRSPSDPALRAAAVRARLRHDTGAAPVPGAAPGAGEASGDGEDVVLARRLAATRPAVLPDAVVDFACRLALASGAEGLRADLVLARAAAARAGWQGRQEATTADVEAVADLALSHRRRRRPMEPPGFPPGHLQQAIDRARRPGDAPGGDVGDGEAHGADRPSASTSERVMARWGDVGSQDPAACPAPLVARPPGPWVAGPDVRGPQVGDRAPAGSWPQSVAPVASVRAGLARRAAHPASPPGLVREDVREPVRRRPARRCSVLVVDASGSMGVQARVDAATGAALGLLADAYRRRHRVALVAFRGMGADVVLPPTASVELARARLADLPTGGATPLAEGLEAAVGVGLAARREGDEADIIVLTDGRATAGESALDRALAEARRAGEEGLPVLVLDAEEGPVRLGLARRLAEAAGGTYQPLGGISPGAVEAAIRQAAPA
jgi:magnesium chelatase subunit D